MHGPNLLRHHFTGQINEYVSIDGQEYSEYDESIKAKILVDGAFAFVV